MTDRARSGWEVRDAVAADAPDLARIQLVTWRAAYAGLIRDDVLAGLSEAAHRARWETWLPVEPPAFCLVAGSPAAGFAAAGHSAEGGELYSLYVLPDLWGRGAGRALLGTALTRLRGAGAVTAGLWVLRGNAKARSFYEALGWTATGQERTEEMYGVELPVVRYTTLLAAPG